jgi:hypothetical protein
VPATLSALRPQQAPLEETFMEITLDPARDRTPGTNGEVAAAAFVMRRRDP